MSEYKFHSEEKDDEDDEDACFGRCDQNPVKKVEIICL
ncbi:hypothetical protein DSOL_4242 [Desulfosporosinus metallidurans]|uniref:Uncharacterized protein n=1 Tax=Desulfosporosinus metallidurans TaxID=1888891 RepID=A0A1Q8QLE9_9FIRM|nr:hypothetical protein DSOL_4242 [Desulfosporosinus metallidurans]